jgi:hypothetical protein
VVAKAESHNKSHEKLALANGRFAPTAAIGAKRSACAGGVAIEEFGDNLDLIVGDQGWRMTTILNGVNPHVAIPAHHVLENGFGKQIGLLPTEHQNGDIDRIPVFPEIDTVMPRVSKGMGNVRVA